MHRNKKGILDAYEFWPRGVAVAWRRLAAGRGPAAPLIDLPLAVIWPTAAPWPGKPPWSSALR